MSTADIILGILCLIAAVFTIKSLVIAHRVNGPPALEKPCIRCRHYRSGDRCAGPSYEKRKPIINLVDGVNTPAADVEDNGSSVRLGTPTVSCGNNRARFDFSYGDPGHCGPLGRHFKAKP